MTAAAASTRHVPSPWNCHRCNTNSSDSRPATAPRTWRCSLRQVAMATSTPTSGTLSSTKWPLPMFASMKPAAIAHASAAAKRCAHCTGRHRSWCIANAIPCGADTPCPCDTQIAAAPQARAAQSVNRAGRTGAPSRAPAAVGHQLLTNASMSALSLSLWVSVMPCGAPG